MSLCLFQIASLNIDDEVMQSMEAENQLGNSAETKHPDPKLKSPVSTAKRRKLDSSSCTEYEREVKKLGEWMEKTESALELLSSESPTSEDSLTDEEQLVLVQDVEKDVKGHSEIFHRLLEQGKTLQEQQKLGEIRVKTGIGFPSVLVL